VNTFRAVDPALKDLINRGVEVFDPAADLWGEGTSQDRRQGQGDTRVSGNQGDGFRSAGFQPGLRGQRGREALFPARRVRGLFHWVDINMESDN
jgi:hypothetical protein